MALPRLLLCSALLMAVPAAAQAPVQVIELRNFDYSPRILHLAAGRPVTLTFVNRAGGAHDFTAVQFFARARLVAGAAPGGSIELQAGQSRSVTLVPAAGRYKVHCGHFMHKQFGMTGSILVR